VEFGGLYAGAGLHDEEGEEEAEMIWMMGERIGFKMRRAGL
jgi:hypothetical protein